ncbi:hypothetical protein Golax_017018 [Gossypium laxum]|uniref:Uncharacterized protein n=1 Tax=Gossypium laxum TaxID=34288 RepID=A0A7J8YYY5_9ROSI|nr:hypothetical protein [Gossypium laxum]
MLLMKGILKKEAMKMDANLTFPYMIWMF